MYPPYGVNDTTMSVSYRGWQLTRGPPIVDILFSNSLRKVRRRFYSLVDVGFFASVGCTAKRPCR